MCAGGGYWVYSSWSWLFPGRIGEAGRYLPDDCNYVVKIQLDRVRKSSIFKGIAEKHPRFKEQVERAYSDQREYLVAVDDIDSITIGKRLMVYKRNGPPDQIDTQPKDIILVETKKDYTAEKIKEGPVFKGLELASTSAGGETIYYHKRPDDDEKNKKGRVPPRFDRGLPHKAFCVLSPKRVLLAHNKEALETVLSRSGDPEVSSRMRSALQKADFGKAVVEILAYKEALRAYLVMPLNPSSLGNWGTADVEDIPAPKWVITEIDTTSQIEVRRRATFESSSNAEEARKIAAAMVIFAKYGAAERKLEELSSALDRCSVSTSGSELQASWSCGKLPAQELYSKQQMWLMRSLFPGLGSGPRISPRREDKSGRGKR